MQVREPVRCLKPYFLPDAVSSFRIDSSKNPLEIEGVLPPVFDGTGGDDEANDEGEAGSYQSDRRSISWREQKREKQDSGPVYRDHGLQSLVCAAGVTT